MEKSVNGQEKKQTEVKSMGKRIDKSERLYKQFHRLYATAHYNRAGKLIPAGGCKPEGMSTKKWCSMTVEQRLDYWFPRTYTSLEEARTSYSRRR